MAIDPKLVSIIPASQLPTGEPTSAGEFFFFEGNEMQKAPMTNIYDKVVGNFSGTLMISDTPSPSEPTWYFAGESGTYTNAGGLVVDLNGKLVVLNYDGTNWIKVEVDIDIDTSDFIIKSDVKDLNLVNEPIDGAVNSDGTLSSLSNTKVVWHQPVTPNTTYEIGGFKAGASKYLALYTDEKVLDGSTVSLVTLPYQFTTNANQRFVSFTVKSASDTALDFANTYLKIVSNDNKVATTEWVEENTITNSDVVGVDLSTLNDVNLFDKQSVVVGRAINSTGESALVSTAGHTDFIKIRPNSSILIRKVSGSPTSGHWYNSNKESISSLTMPSGNGLISSPPDAHYLRANVYNASSNINDNLNAFMVSQSTEIVDYVPYKQYISSINGYEIPPQDNETESVTSLDDILKPLSNYENNRLRGIKSRLGFFGDSWTDGVNGALRWVRDIANIFRDKYGNGGMGWYDFALSQGEGSSQKMGCAVLTDANDTRSGTINYVDQAASAKGINIAHATLTTGSSIVLNLLEGQDVGAIHIFGGSGYGSITYQIGSGTVEVVDTSVLNGYSVIPITLNGVAETITITCTIGSCIVLGVYAEKNNTYPVINKFGNRGLRAFNYTEVDKGNWQDALLNFNLDSLFYLIGTNDRTVGRSPSQFKADIVYFYDMVEEISPFVDMYFIAPSNNKLTAITYPMQEFAKALRDVSVDKGAGFVNLIPLYGSTGKIIDKGTFQDDVHPIADNPIAEYVYSRCFI